MQWMWRVLPAGALSAGCAVVGAARGGLRGGALARGGSAIPVWRPQCAAGDIAARIAAHAVAGFALAGTSSGAAGEALDCRGARL